MITFVANQAFNNQHIASSTYCITLHIKNRSIASKTEKSTVLIQALMKLDPDVLMKRRKP